MADNTANPIYVMHPLIQGAYQRVHDWFDTQLEMRGYDKLTHKGDPARILKRENLKDSAFNFNYYFPTHFFKACHALQADQVIGLEKLASWLRYNPYLTVIDVGCGDGAGSVAVIDSLLKLREEDQLDARRIQVFCVAVDPNINGLYIYNKMLTEVSQSVVNLGINVNIAVVKSTVSEASGATENHLFKMRHQWKQPSLSHAVFIMSNLTDILYGKHHEESAMLNKYDQFGASLKEPFGEPVSAFVRHLFGEVPIDHLHMLSIDTEPEQIQLAVSQMVDDLQVRMNEKGHLFDHSSVQLETIKIKNPEPAYWRKKQVINYEIKPFVIFSGHIDNHDLAADQRWKQIIAPENLELAWARARQEMLRESFVDEIEIRLFDQNLDGNLTRLHFELENYAVRSGYLTQILNYGFPKDSNTDRQRGLTWLEEEILMVAIIQVIGITQLRNSPQSYAYQLSPENSRERGATEYLYEYWSAAWKRYIADIKDYAGKYPKGIVIKTDIKSYFTRILHDRLQNILKDELQVSKRIEWLLELLVSKNIPNHDLGVGLVQGSIGSGFLSNLYLTPFDNLFPQNDPKKRKLFRYVDDIMAVIPDQADEISTKTEIESVLDELKLAPNIDKTETYQVPEFLELYEADTILDNLYKRYETMLDPLWWLDDNLRSDFRKKSEHEVLWWSGITLYRSCLTELGLYMSEVRLSREISRKIMSDSASNVVLNFADLPEDGTFSNARTWANQFRLDNADWWLSFETMRKELSQLFQDNLNLLQTPDISKRQKEVASRRLRFAANRLGILGLGEFHIELTKILCETPWLLRDQVHLLEDLARQGYVDDIWTILNFHISANREMSPYMSAITLRALRYVPHLDVDGWKKLTLYIFVDQEIIQLMASETWLLLSAEMETTPNASQVLENLRRVFSDRSLQIPRRLLKNYLLMLGKLDFPALNDLISEEIKSDALLAQAYKLAKSMQASSSILLRVEPEIIRQKYYSNKYRHFEEIGDESPH